jgi:flavin-dependent dehydrogenase
MNRSADQSREVARKDANQWAEKVERSVEVFVLGGGPAGLATALELERAGRSVVVVERSQYDTPRIGESLPPEIRLPLMELGIWKRFLDDNHSHSPGTVSAWGSPELWTNDFLLNSHGLGWHVDRRRFDLTIADAAASRSIEVFRNAHLAVWQRASPRGWKLQVAYAGALLNMRASVLVDASGRTGSPIRHFGGRRIFVDRLVGVVGFIGTFGAQIHDQRTLVEAVENGWWYSAWLPQGHYIAAFMTDADLLPKERLSVYSWWLNELQTAPHTLSRVGVRPSCMKLRIVAANTSRLEASASNDWVAVGDAAAALDPLSAQGVYRALITGQAAAAAVDEYLRGRPRLEAYSRQVIASFEADLQDRTVYYRRERRWPNSPFWRRRHSLNTAIEDAVFTKRISDLFD